MTEFSALARKMLWGARTQIDTATPPTSRGPLKWADKTFKAYNKCFTNEETSTEPESEV